MATALLCLAGATLIACGDDDEGGHAAGAAQQGSAAGREQPTTDDGYPIVMANPHRQGGPTPSRPGEGRQNDEHLVREPNSPDPHGGAFSLEEAVEDLAGQGQLVAEINTDLGTLICDLYADRMPNTVANFIGLARGKRAFWDARAAAWVKRPHYSRTEFHRVIPDYLIQGGDYLGDGTGNAGYFIADERHETLRHDRAGLLCMASEGPNKSSSQFFVTDGPTRQLDQPEDGRAYPIVGLCQPLDVVERIARVPQNAEDDNHPLTPVVISRVMIRRVPGGADQARPTPPQPTFESDPNVQPQGASPGPAGLDPLQRRRALEAPGSDPGR